VRRPAIAVFLIGCATVGRNFDATSPSWLHERTTKAVIEEKLGPPLRVGSDAGVPTWTLGDYEYRVFGESNNVIRFSPGGTVRSYMLATSFLEEKKKLDPAVH